MFESENERGISNLIATLILIAVALVGGAFAYAAFRGQAQSTRTNADAMVQVSAMKPAGGDANFSATIKNTGTVQLDDVRVTVDNGSTQYIFGDDNLVNDIPTLSPGQTKSGSLEAAGFSAGETYIVSIEADTPGEGNITKTMTVRVD